MIVSATSESPDYAAAAADGYAEALVKVEGDPLALGASASIPTTPFENRSAPAERRDRAAGRAPARRWSSR